MDLKRFENLRSVQEYLFAWNKIHKPETLTKRGVSSWIKSGRIKSHQLGATMIEGGLEVEKRPRGAKKKFPEGFIDEEKYCELCDRLFDDLPKHMKKHARIAERVRKYELKKAGN